MKIILDNEDIKKLIETNYNGVTDVKLPNDLEVSVTVDSESYAKVPQKNINNNQTVPTKKVELTPEVKNQLEAKQGVMASGGVRRTLQRFG